VTQILDSFFEEPIQPIALNNGVVRNSRLSVEEFDRVSDWFKDLPIDSPWHHSYYPQAAASTAVRLKRLRSDQYAVFSSYVSYPTLLQLAVEAALESDDTDLKFLLTEIASRFESEARRVMSFGASVPIAKRRQIVLKLASLCRDNNIGVRSGALYMIRDICISVALERELHSIRSRELDEIHRSLAYSSEQSERAAAIALFAVHQPRVSDDWAAFNSLLRSANKEEIDLDWRWVLLQYADFATDVRTFARHITDSLRDSSDTAKAALLTDILTKVLPRESQSLSSVMIQLALPTTGTSPGDR
jgi:hypothetical protein